MAQGVANGDVTVTATTAAGGKRLRKFEDTLAITTKKLRSPVGVSAGYFSTVLWESSIAITYETTIRQEGHAAAAAVAAHAANTTAAIANYAAGPPAARLLQ